jgi:hypothetical protein
MDHNYSQMLSFWSKDNVSIREYLVDSIYMPPIRLFMKQNLSVFHKYTYPKQTKLPQTPMGFKSVEVNTPI